MRILPILAVLFPIAASAGTLTTLATVPAIADSGYPQSSLVTFEGKLYGTTTGAGDPGTVFSINPTTGTKTTIYTFTNGTDGGSPVSALTPFQGKLYGSTSQYGANKAGTIFEVDPSTGSLTTLYGLPSQSGTASALVAFHGILYGTMTGGTAQRGTIFSIDPVSQAGQTLFEFSRHDGGTPTGLIVSQNALYGTASTNGAENKGTIFKFTPASLHLKVEYAFSKSGGDSETPIAGLAEYNGQLYGVARAGGTAGLGTVFAFDPVLEKETVVYSFTTSDEVTPCSTPAALNGMLYGLAGPAKLDGDSAVYAIDPAQGSVTIVHRFSLAEGALNPTPFPVGPLVIVGGQLYGTLEFVSYGGYGSIFAVDPATGANATLHAFVGGLDAHVNDFVKNGAYLFGSTQGGGANGLGSIFRVHPGKLGFTTIYSFSGNDGAHPGNLVNIGGIFYGIAGNGGKNNFGTLFSFDPATRALTTLYTFSGKNVDYAPDSNLVQVGNVLYASRADYGTLFEFDLTTLKATVVTGVVSGAWITAANGLIYGENRLDGNGNADGILFQVDPASGTSTILYTFQGTNDSANPDYGLAYLNGALFGTTNPSHNAAANFKFNLATNGYTKHTLPSRSIIATGLTPAGNNLAGVVSAYATSETSLVSVSPGSGKITTLVQLESGASFVYQYRGTPVLYTNGTFYGAISSGASPHGATIFAFKNK